MENNQHSAFPIPQPKIEISDLRVVFPGRGNTGPVEALAGVSLDVAAGEFVCIVGPSGCGKTTLLRVLAGLETAVEGSATIYQSDPARPPMAMVFQNSGIFPWMTVRQNVAYGLQLRRVPQQERNRATQRWISEIGLDRFAHSYPSQLSGGMKQRVGLARAFALDPEVLLMDEPFGALDAQTRLILQQTLLQQWERDDKTIVFVTHSIEEALTLGDRVYVMSARPGKLLREFAVPFSRPRDPVAVHADPRMGELYAEIWSVLRDEVDRARLAEQVLA